MIDMYIVLFVILFLVWYTHRLSTYNMGVIKKVKFKSTIGIPKPSVPKNIGYKGPKPINLSKNKEIQNLQKQTAQFKAIANQKTQEERKILQDSARKIAVENRRRQELVRAQQIAADQKVRDIQARGTEESRRIR